jgi:hypothetical protein
LFLHIEAMHFVCAFAVFGALGMTRLINQIFPAGNLLGDYFLDIGKSRFLEAMLLDE